MSEPFNPLEWLSLEAPDGGNSPANKENTPQQTEANKSDNPNIEDNTELIISRIESVMADITSTYDKWLKVGFAFADEYGEFGRSYFHRVSRYYPGYSQEACNRQYDQCLKSKGHGVTIKTFFAFAQEAGIDIRANKPFNPSTNQSFNPSTNQSSEEVADEEDTPIVLPTLPDEIFPYLPQLLQDIVTAADTKEERDILLLGSIGCLSACLPNLYGFYDKKKMFANLYVYITAQASAGKGCLIFCKHLVKPVHWSLRRQTNLMKQEYENELRDFNSVRAKDIGIEKPEKPPERMLLIPANSSATGMFQLLYENKGRGLIFETEGDTLAQAFKADFSNYSDGMRKAFPHEPITYYRKTDHEFVEIEMPCLSALLSSTPKQVAALMPNAENGLFSRFLFYHMEFKPKWKDVFSDNNDNDWEGHFIKLGKDVLNLYEALDSCNGIKFSFTIAQKERFHQFFSELHDRYYTLQTKDYMGTVRRLGPVAFRIGMILTALRIIETGDLSELQECSDADFNAALAIIDVVVRHASYVFSQLPEDVKLNKPKNKKEQFFEKLPERFNKKEYLETAKSLEISERSAIKYVEDFCKSSLINREQRDSYWKLRSRNKKNGITDNNEDS